MGSVPGLLVSSVPLHSLHDLLWHDDHIPSSKPDPRRVPCLHNHVAVGLCLWRGGPLLRHQVLQVDVLDKPVSICDEHAHDNKLLLRHILVPETVLMPTAP